MANYGRQRERVTPPHITLAAARRIAGLTLSDMSDRLAGLGYEMSIGALSGIENGHRGASEQAIEGLAAALDIEVDQITTDYQPKRWRRVDAA